LQIVLILPLIIFIYLGVFSDFAIGREFSLNSQRFFLEIKTHIFISYGSVFFAAIIGIWLGIYTYKSNKKETKLFYFLNIIQTIPGIALFGIVMVPLGFISSSFSGLKNIGISGIGTAPAMLVLFLYSLLPVVKNTLEGLKSIDGSIIESGRGMGMSGFEIFLKIELPLSIPVILNGIRIALVHCVGSTAVAALIGAGGLGVFIFQGIGQGASDLIVLGSLPLIIIAVITDKFMELMTNIFKPKGSF
jgi:osmoprotectant transport system permease protein